MYIIDLYFSFAEELLDHDANSIMASFDITTF